MMGCGGASGFFCVVWEVWDDVGRFGLAWGGLGRGWRFRVGVLCVGTVRVLEISSNRPRVGGCHGVCEISSLITAPGQFVSNLAAQLLLLFANGFVNQGLQNNL